MNFAMKRRKQFQEDPVAEEVEGVDVYDIRFVRQHYVCRERHITTATISP